MSNYYQSHADKIIKSTLTALELAGCNYNQDLCRDAEQMQFVTNYVEKLCEGEQRLKFEKTAMPAFSCPEYENFDGEYQKLVVNFQSSYVPHGTERYKKFEQRLEDIQYVNNQAGTSNVTQSVTVDGMVVQDSTQAIDPITKNPIRDPVRNKLCKHIYDRESITSAIEMNRRIRCPYLGCSNKKHLTLADIEDDRDFNRRIMQENQESHMEIE